MDTIFWLILVAVFLIIEILTLGLTTVWFAGGALVAAIASILNAGLLIQIILFLLVAVILLFFTRPIAAKYLNGRTQKTNADSLIGQTCFVTLTINNVKAQGQATINGLEWTARALSNDDIIPEGTEVIIRQINGVKLIVEQYQEV